MLLGTGSVIMLYWMLQYFHKTFLFQLSLVPNEVAKAMFLPFNHMLAMYVEKM